MELRVSVVDLLSIIVGFAIMKKKKEAEVVYDDELHLRHPFSWLKLYLIKEKKNCFFFASFTFNLKVSVSSKQNPRITCTTRGWIGP